MGGFSLGVTGDGAAPARTPQDGAQDRFPIGLVAQSGDDAAHALIASIGRTRGFALNVGTLAVICATAEDEGERAEAARELAAYGAQFRDTMMRADGEGWHLADRQALRLQRRVIRRFLDAIGQLGECGWRPSRAQAVEVAAFARGEVLEAIYAMIANIQEHEARRLAVRMEGMARRGALLDKIMSDMARISRMIGMVSINASVEAARSGGESGRAFQVISAEIRDLASQSAGLLTEMRQRLEENEGRPAASDQRRSRASRSAST